MPSTSPEPPRKKRRTNNFPSLSDRDSNGSSQEPELPSNDSERFIEVDDDILENHRSKYEHVMHEPEYVESQTNVYVTQVDQPWSSPTRIRGPRWRKQDATPSPPLRSADRGGRPLVADEFDDEELEAIMAEEALRPSKKPGSSPHQARSTVQQSKSMRQTTLFGVNTTETQRPTATQRAHNYPLAAAQRNEPPTHHNLNEEALQTWIYPLNVGTIRDYQFNIVHKALYSNILVALPTGLGKTFIAATVMLNWYRWTKDAQIIFMAPTKPLVAQQVEACFHIAGIPRSQTTLMTGEIPAAIRAEEWQEKRVFFMTPQTLINDLKTGIADPKKIILLVVDEAHKGTGNYAYVEVVRFVQRFNTSFRVLALTATPGATVEAVQKVINGLNIARVEIRTEDSLDIRSFVHTRNTETELFDYSEEQNLLIELFGKMVKPVLDKLSSQNLFWGRDPTQITLFGLMKARQGWMASEAGRKANMGVKGMMHACFTPLMTLAHNLELLKFHGMTPFFHKMKQFQDEAAGSNGKYTRQIVDSQPFKELMSHIRAWIQNDDFLGHPKLEYLNRVVMNHFLDAGSGNLLVPTQNPAGVVPIAPSDTRIMIFAHYRDSAEDITRVLARHQPLIRPHVFVGQTATKKSDGMDQKTQIDIIKKFKAGTYNTLVATSIGEEGLDIGEVDLIIMYDCSKSPIRMLQRMGRTGRKRAGNIVCLLMKQKEARDYEQAKDNYKKMQDIIESGRDFEFKTEESKRILPRHVVPVVDKRVVEIPVENTQADPSSIEPSRSKKAKKTKRPPKKFFMPDNVETGFQFLGSKSRAIDNEKPSDRTSKKKSEKANKNKIGKTKVGVEVEEKDAILPSLDQVLLNKSEEEDLQARYATIGGSEEQFIQTVNVGRKPEKLRFLDRTARVPHSLATKRYIAAGQAMRGDSREWQRPDKPALTLTTESRQDELFYISQPVLNHSLDQNGTENDGNNDSQDEAPFYVSQRANANATNNHAGDRVDADEPPDLDDLLKSATIGRETASTKQDGGNQSVHPSRNLSRDRDDDRDEDEDGDTLATDIVPDTDADTDTDTDLSPTTKNTKSPNQRTSTSTSSLTANAKAKTKPKVKARVDVSLRKRRIISDDDDEESD